MSEYVLGWLLALERRIIERAALSHWHGVPDRSLTGRSIGIMGTGSIGSHVAKTCAVFGLDVRGLNSDGRTVPGFDRCFASADRLAFAEGLDYLVAVLPDTAESTGLVDSRLLALLGEQAIFINAGRANCVREPDLLRALEHGPLAAAVLDVLPQEPLADDDPLWQVERLYITSHTAAPTAVDAAVDIFCDNYRRYQSGKELRHVVDFARGY
jgi:phosphoglycerate dehydrogenase-like enzyme